MSSTTTGAPPETGADAAGPGAAGHARLQRLARGSRMQDWADRFAGSDPGLNRLRMAAQVAVAIGLALLAEFWFVRLTHALQIDTHGAVLPAAQAAAVAAQHHGLQIIAMLLGAVVAMIASFGVSDPTPRGQAVSMLLVPVPMLASLALGLAIGDYRVLALSSLAVVLAAGTYLRRFGPRGFLAGMLLFMGDFFGFFLHGELHLADIGWLAAEIAIGVLVAMVVNFTVFHPDQRRALARTQRSFAARARKVARTALEQFDAPGRTPGGGRHARDLRGPRRLQRQLARLNEAALMIDAQLADPAAVSAGSSARLLHERLFDTELALSNIARFSEALSRVELPVDVRDGIRDALVAVRYGNLEQAELAARALLDLPAAQRMPGAGSARTRWVLLRRFAGSVIAYADALTAWFEAGDRAQSTDEDAAFIPAAMLFAGWLPGSAMVSAQASTERGTARADRLQLAPYTRTAIQMLVAVGSAIAIGDVLSGRRFYWAVIAAFITFMGANNAGEQIRKAGLRVVGTVVGIMVGSALVHLVGHRTNWSLALILVALFLGVYLMRISYAFMVIGITVMVSQLYVQLDEFSNHLLVLRLEETALGAAVAVLTVLVVFPLRTRHASAVAGREFLAAARGLVEATADQLEHGASATTLRTAARKLDAAHHSLAVTVKPLQRTAFGTVNDRVAEVLQVAAAARHYARDLAIDAGQSRELDPASRIEFVRSARTLAASLDQLEQAVTATGGTHVYTRAASLVAGADARLGADTRHATELLLVRDVQRLDGAMARLASLLGIAVTDLDTSQVGCC